MSRGGPVRRHRLRAAPAAVLLLAVLAGGLLPLPSAAAGAVPPEALVLAPSASLTGLRLANVSHHTHASSGEPVNYAEAVWEGVTTRLDLCHEDGQGWLLGSTRGGTFLAIPFDPAAEVSLRREGTTLTLTARLGSAQSIHVHAIPQGEVALWVHGVALVRPSDADAPPRETPAPTPKPAPTPPRPTSVSFSDFLVSKADIVKGDVVLVTGRVAVEGLPPGTYLVNLTANGATVASSPVELAEGRRATAKFTFGPEWVGELSLRLEVMGHASSEAKTLKVERAPAAPPPAPEESSWGPVQWAVAIAGILSAFFAFLQLLPARRRSG